MPTGGRYFHIDTDDQHVAALRPAHTDKVEDFAVESMHEFAERSEIGRGMKLPELTQSSRSAIVVATIVASGLLLLGPLTAPAFEAQDNRSTRILQGEQPCHKTLAVDTAKLSCLTPALIQQIKSDLPNIADAYNECRAEITERTKDMQLDDLGHRVVFATIATNASAPLAASPPISYPTCWPRLP